MQKIFHMISLINLAYIHNGYLSVILCINLATFRDGYIILTYLIKSSLIANKIAIIFYHNLSLFK